MPSKSKAKGNTFEREHVNWLRSRGYPSKRGWGSSGLSMGLPECVDVTLEESHQIQWEPPKHHQLKRRAKLPNYLHIPRGADCVVFREDRGKTLVLMYAEDVWPEL